MGGGRLLAPKVAPRRKIEKKKRIYKAQYTTYYEKIGEKENKGSFCVKNLLTYVQRNSILNTRTWAALWSMALT